jgi:tetratricopeptide (TPR) repeat protein
VLAAAGAALFGLLRTDRRPAAEESSPAAVRQAIAVLDFKNLSPSVDKRWLDTAFAEMLTTELAAGGSLRVIRGETVAQAWRSLALRDAASLGPDDLARLHEALGTDLVVVGSYLPMGGRIRLDLRVLQAPGGETVASVAEVGSEPGLFELVSRTGNALRSRLGIAELSAQQVRQTQALSPASPEGRRLYAEGLARLRAFDPPGALDLLRRAAAADPGSPVIHSALAQSWGVLGYDERALAEARRAQDLAGPLSREERLAIEGRLHKAAKSWEKASQTYRSLSTFFPDDIEYGLQLAECLLAGGRGAEAAAALAALRKLPPPAGVDPRIDLLEARNASRLSDFATVRKAAETAEAKGRKSGQSLIVAQALVYQGEALMKLGRTREAIELFREAAALCEKAGYLWGVGQAQANIAFGLQTLGDLDGAQAANEESLAIARRLGSAIGIVWQLYSLGELHRERGEQAEAFSLLDQSRQWSLRLGDRLRQAQALNGMGLVLHAQGDLDGARQRFERALSLSRSVGSPIDEAVSIDRLGGLLAARGELAEARRRHGKAFAALQKAGDSSQAASALAAWADAAARLGDLRSAWSRSAQALAAKRRAGDRVGAGRILGLRSRFAYEMGNLAASRALAGDQLRIARETGARSLAARALLNLGRADFAAGDLSAARRSLNEALEVSSALGEDVQAMEIRVELAKLALARDRPAEAAPLAREAVAWCRARGMSDGEAEALSLLAEALVRTGLAGEAREAAADAGSRLAGSEDRPLRVVVGVRLARLQALGDPQEALRLLRQAAGEAQKYGLVAAGLEARLMLAEMERVLRDPAAEARLAAVREEAAARGFQRLAALAPTVLPHPRPLS